VLEQNLLFQETASSDVLATTNSGFVSAEEKLMPVQSLQKEQQIFVKVGVNNPTKY